MSKLINEDIINSLKDLKSRDGTRLIDKLLELYLEKTPNVIENMRDSVSRESLEELSGFAHSLKSSSGNIGAEAMYQICNVIEEDIVVKKKEDISHYNNLVENLGEIYNLTATGLKDLEI